jgi:hypothetical protein
MRLLINGGFSIDTTDNDPSCWLSLARFIPSPPPRHISDTAVDVQIDNQGPCVGTNRAISDESSFLCRFLFDAFLF